MWFIVQFNSVISFCVMRLLKSPIIGNGASNIDITSVYNESVTSGIAIILVIKKNVGNDWK